MAIDWTKPLRVKGQGWPVEVISDKGRRPGYPMLCYVRNSVTVEEFNYEGCDAAAYYQLENVPEKLYVMYNRNDDNLSPAGVFCASELPFYVGVYYKLYELVETTVDKAKEEAK